MSDPGAPTSDLAGDDLKFERLTRAIRDSSDFCDAGISIENYLNDPNCAEPAIALQRLNEFLRDEYDPSYVMEILSTTALLAAVSEGAKRILYTLIDPEHLDLDALYNAQLVWNGGTSREVRRGMSVRAIRYGLPELFKKVELEDLSAVVLPVPISYHNVAAGYRPQGSPTPATIELMAFATLLTRREDDLHPPALLVNRAVEYGMSPHVLIAGLLASTTLTGYRDTYLTVDELYSGLNSALRAALKQHLVAFPARSEGGQPQNEVAIAMEDRLLARIALGSTKANHPVMASP